MVEVPGKIKKERKKECAQNGGTIGGNGAISVMYTEARRSWKNTLERRPDRFLNFKHRQLLNYGAPDRRLPCNDRSNRFLAEPRPTRANTGRSTTFPTGFFMRIVLEAKYTKIHVRTSHYLHHG